MRHYRLCVNDPMKAAAFKRSRRAEGLLPLPTGAPGGLAELQDPRVTI
jgi:hypothetical protein